MVLGRNGPQATLAGGERSRHCVFSHLFFD